MQNLRPRAQTCAIRVGIFTRALGDSHAHSSLRSFVLKLQPAPIDLGHAISCLGGLQRWGSGISCGGGMGEEPGFTPSCLLACFLLLSQRLHLQARRFSGKPLETEPPSLPSPGRASS